MIWFALLRFAITFVLTALFAPKPDIENARPEGLDSENFPRASEDAPVPLVLGCAWMRSPNTLWYGGFRTVPITERVKTGLFSSETVIVGHNYYLSFDLGLCLGDQVELKQIRVDDEQVGPGEGNIDGISRESLFNNSEFGFGSTFTRYTLEELGVTEEEVDTGQTLFTNTFTTDGGFYVFGSGIAADMRSVAHVRAIAEDGVSFLGNEEVVDNTPGGPERVTALLLLPPGTRFVDVRSFFTFTLPFFVRGGVVTSRAWTLEGAPAPRVFSSDIYAPELYGGEKRGGGLISDFTYYTGDFDPTVQPPNPVVEGFLGAGNVPAYLGVAHIVMEDAWIGETPSLRKMEFLLARYTNDLVTEHEGRNEDAGDDINLAEALYHILTNGWSGLDIDTGLINVQSFRDAAATLIDEGNGGSIVISSPGSGRVAVEEILRQIDGVLAENANGELLLKLIRDDYDADLLPIYDEDDILEISNYSRNTWQDVVSQVKVSFPSRTKTSTTRVALAQNPALLNMIGRVKSADISFPFCYDPALANRLAARELSQLSIPLVRFTAVMNRNGYRLSIGDVIKVTFPEFGISELICRVQNRDRGTLEDNRVTVTLVQDVFAANSAVFLQPEDTGWVSDRPTPQPITVSEIVDIPYFLGQQLENPVADGFGGVAALTRRPRVGSTAFSFRLGLETGVLSYSDPNVVEYPFSGIILSDYNRAAGFENGIDAVGLTIGNLTGPATQELPAAATIAEIRAGNAGLIYLNGEWMAYEGVVDNGGGSITLTNIHRGLMGTTPQTHEAGNFAYLVTPTVLGRGGVSSTLLEDGTIYYKLLDFAGGIERASGSEEEQTYVLQDVADRPLRPRNLQMNGSRNVPFVTGTTVDLTWIPSNRTQGQISFELDPAEVPDQAEEYDLEIWVDGVQDMARSQTNVTSPHTIDFTGVTGLGGEVRLYSRRTVGDMKRSTQFAVFPLIITVKADSTLVTIDTTSVTGDKT